MGKCQARLNVTPQNNGGQLDSCSSYEFLMSTEALGGIGNQMSMYASLLVVSSMSGYMPRISEVVGLIIFSLVEK